jgi:hypothetical protein
LNKNDKENKREVALINKYIRKKRIGA